jgi:glutamate--cysteine ligase catalytic subunit
MVIIRRLLAQEYLKPNETIISMTSFPRLGAPGVFLDPHSEPEGQASHSLFVPDETINPHVRFP